MRNYASSFVHLHLFYSHPIVSQLIHRIKAIAIITHYSHFWIYQMLCFPLHFYTTLYSWKWLSILIIIKLQLRKKLRTNILEHHLLNQEDRSKTHPLYMTILRNICEGKNVRFLWLKWWEQMKVLYCIL